MAMLHVRLNNIGQRLSRVLIVAVMAALAMVIFASPSRTADQTWSDVLITIDDLIDEGVSTFKVGDVKSGKDKVNDAYYKYYEITGVEKQVMARISGSHISQVEMGLPFLRKTMNDADSVGINNYATTLKQYMVEDGTPLDGVVPGSAAQASSDDYSPGAWGEVVKTINDILEDGVNTYKGGGAKASKGKINEVYYKHYEITGTEKQVMSRISSSRVSQVEMKFSLLKRAMTDDDPTAIDQHLSTLMNYIREDTNSLGDYAGEAVDKTTDGSGTSPWIVQFLPSFFVILREDMEVILVVAAVLACLAKTGHKNKAPIMRSGVVFVFGLSIGLAFLFSYITLLTGVNQELLKGFAALFVVVALIQVSDWMTNKSSSKAWGEYIKRQTDASLSSGFLLGLALISSLTALCEGAETILFYTPIVITAGDKTHYVWIGLAVGLVTLVIIHLPIQFAVVRIPLRPFFTITSLLMTFVAFTFTDSGIGELQRADVVSLTPISGFPAIDLLGIYPRMKNLAAQATVLAIIVDLYFFGKARLAREATAQS